LAQQAAKLAAESQADSAAAANVDSKTAAKSPQKWSSRDGEVRISDADSQSTNAAGWRTQPLPSQSGDVQIQFKDKKATTLKSDNPPKSDKSAAAVADQISAETSNSHTASEPKTISDRGVQLASRTISESDVRTANEQEPMPTPSHSANGNGNSGNSGSGNGGSHNYNDGNGYGSCGGNSCDMGCCAPPPCLFWTAGVEATFLSPNLNDNGASFEFVNTSEGRDCFSTTNGLDSLYVAPRLWLGVQSCCWGVDVKYWQMRASETGWDPALGQGGVWDGPDCGTPDIAHFSQNTMSAYSLDLEVTRRLCVRDCWMQFSAGVRHAEFRHDQVITGNAIDSLPGATINDPAIATNLIGYARDDSFSQGTGIVLGWYGRRPVFPCSCVNWFYNLHYSVLWGPTDTAAETAAQIVVDDPGSAGSTNNARTHSDGTFTIGEVQLGLEWDYALQCVPANSFFRVALEYQRWDGGNGSSEAESFAGTTINGETNQGKFLAQAFAPEMNLFGFTIGTGLTW